MIIESEFINNKEPKQFPLRSLRINSLFHKILIIGSHGSYHSSRTRIFVSVAITSPCNALDHEEREIPLIGFSSLLDINVKLMGRIFF